MTLNRVHSCGDTVYNTSQTPIIIRTRHGSKTYKGTSLVVVTSDKKTCVPQDWVTVEVFKARKDQPVEPDTDKRVLGPYRYTLYPSNIASAADQTIELHNKVVNAVQKAGADRYVRDSSIDDAIKDAIAGLEHAYTRAS